MSIDATSETAIFERIVLPAQNDLSAEAAKSLLAMGFGSEDIQRMHELADKSRQGTLTPDEQLEIGNYQRVGHYLAILQSKARIALRGSTDADP